MGLVKAHRQPIAGLDILRFLSACLVMFFHLAMYDWVCAGTTMARIVGGRAAYPELLGLTWFGFVGVEIFFVISGIVICISAERSMAAGFLRSRILRLYPAVWICATASTIVLLLFQVGEGDHLESSRTILSAYFHSLTLLPREPWADVSYWTLPVEMAFYFAVFLLLVYSSAKRIGTLGYCLGVVSFIYWAGGVFCFHDAIFSRLWSNSLNLTLINNGIFFSLGIVIYTLRQRGFSYGRCGFAFLLLIAAAIEIGLKVEAYDFFLRWRESVVTPITVFLIAVAAMMASLFWSAPPKLGSFLRLVGLTTYPLYLLHGEIGAVMIRLLVDAGVNRFAALGTAATLCIAFSMMIVAFVEMPVRRLIARLLDLMGLPACTGKTATLLQNQT